jgi:SAM-dependent methyltransferase
MFNKVKHRVESIYESFKLRNKFNKDFKLYNKLAENSKAQKKDLYPCLYDASSYTVIESTYFYQDAWAFERIYKNKPVNHIDVGSHHKFVSLLSKITTLTMIDIRPLSLGLNSINFLKGDILNLPFKNNSIDSLSSLCVIEHIGLGRYGDKIDPEGSEKAFLEINRVLKRGANFYFSVPIENENKVYFNAHRAFKEDYILNQLLQNFEILDKKYIYGNDFQNNLDNSMFGIGCYHLIKTK